MSISNVFSNELLTNKWDLKNRNANGQKKIGYSHTFCRKSRKHNLKLRGKWHKNNNFHISNFRNRQALHITFQNVRQVCSGFWNNSPFDYGLLDLVYFRGNCIKPEISFMESVEIKHLLHCSSFCVPSSVFRREHLRFCWRQCTIVILRNQSSFSMSVYKSV